MSYYIAMDVGGTHARLLIADPSGRILLQTEGLGGTIPGVGMAEMGKRLRNLIVPVLAQLSLPPSGCAGLCMGASGIDTPELREQYLHILTDMGFDAACIQAYNDCEVLLSLVEGACITVISGTGSIATGRLGEGQPVVRCGGWSYVLSDEGSATDISFSAMRAVIRHYDGQLNCPVLAERFASRYGFTEPERLVEWCHANIMNKEKLASLAPVVVQAAADGDTVAHSILESSVESLAQLVLTVSQKLGLQKKPHPVILWGSVLTQSELVRDMLIKRLAEVDPCGESRQLTGSAIENALTLAMQKKC